MDKQLPYNLEAEQATNGSCLLNRDAIVAIADWLKPEHFYSEQQRLIYGAIVDCYRRRVPPDTKTVYEALRKAEQIDLVGGMSALTDITSAVPTSYHVEYYAQDVFDTAVRRQGIAACMRGVTMFYDESSPLDETKAAVQTVITKAMQETAKARFITAAEGLERLLDMLGSDVNPGIPTGFRDLDEMTGGFHAEDLIILAARPSVGKSALALCLEKHIAETTGPVLMFSFEMSHMQVFQRFASMDTGIPLAAIRDHKLQEGDLDRIVSSISRHQRLPLLVDDTPNRTVNDLRSQCQRWIAEHGPVALVVVDYLQLMNAGSKYQGQRVNEVSEMSRGLKLLAREINAPVLALAQLSRAVEGRQDKIPMLSDLRDSGAIEQDADIVMFIHREEMYDRETEKKGIAELIIAKQRNGQLGIIPLRFNGMTTQFHTLTYRTPDGY